MNKFDILNLIGKGSYAEVVVASKKDNNDHVAIKIINKNKMISKEVYTRNVKKEFEINILLNKHNKCPYIVKLHNIFNDNSYIYFVYDFLIGGELFTLISGNKLSRKIIQFFAAEIVIALNHLHSLNIIYSDLKPENICITKDGHINLVDFGLSLFNGEIKKYYSGTIPYLPPEVLTLHKYTFAVDWWSLGIVIYEMLTGSLPWDEEEPVDCILHDNIIFTKDMKEVERNIISKFLIKNYIYRLKDIDDIYKHPYFNDINFDNLSKGHVNSPFTFENKNLLSNFSSEFTNGPITYINPDPCNNDTFDNFIF